MNKDTLTGMLLIFAVLFGFMYCNQPDPNATKNDSPTGQQAAPDSTAIRRVRFMSKPTAAA